MALAKAGVASIDEAMEMSPLMCDKTLSLLSAWSIPAARREGGVVDATPEIIDGIYG